MDVKRILVFRLSSIGDIILTSALIRCIRKTYPNALIDFVVKAQFQELVSSNPHISNVYVVNKKEGFKGLRKLKNQLSEKEYDVFLDIHKNFRSIFFRTFFPARKIYKYKKNILKRFLLVAFKIDTYKNELPVYRRFVETAKHLNIEWDNRITDFFIPQKSIESLNLKLKHEDFPVDKPYIVLCPGASFSNKQWPFEYFIALCNSTQLEEYTLVLIGGKAEQLVCSDIVKGVTKSIFDFSGELSLLESAAILKNATATVSNDTGMLHLSEALDVPVIGLYGPTVKQFGYYPIHEKSVGLSVDLSCRPCTKMGKNYCPKKHHKCMRNLTPEMVLDELQKLI